MNQCRKTLCAVKRKAPAAWRMLQQTFNSLARDTSGNALMIMAFAVVPLFMLVGSSLDMGRSYMAQTRLQQACDSGTLAARKELGAIPNFNVSLNGAAITTKANRFFNVNFPDKLYNVQNRNFQIAIQNDLSITGVASALVPTDVMRLFGKKDIALTVTCRAELSIPNTDVMMALDVTGSMLDSNPSDTTSKLNILKTVVKNFYTTMESVKQTSSRLRYGFVPYSTNVNVGGVLKDEWVASSWVYPSRVLGTTTKTPWTNVYYIGWTKISGSIVFNQSLTQPAQKGSIEGQYYCSLPNNSITETPWVQQSVKTEAVTNPNGTKTTTVFRRTLNGKAYWADISGTTCTIYYNTYTNYLEEFTEIKEPRESDVTSWIYKDVTLNTSNWRNETSGCIEERSTYEINDYDNVDLSRALDLDIDRVPSSAQPATQWKPMYSTSIFERSMRWVGYGSFTTAEVTTNDDFLAPHWSGYAACPTESKKLATWTKTDFDAYVDGLTAAGNTYHDIGMIWAARLLSPTGLFASENADVSAANRTSRHLIFLTDGQTEPLDVSYGSYGVEPLSQRRWRESSPLTLTQTVEKRFTFACEEAKKKNITVWFVAFGTTLNPIMTQCAGPGRSFSASNAGELQNAFLTIAKNIGSLRLSE
jgi:Flp pilus assembly protein TadG